MSNAELAAFQKGVEACAAYLVSRSSHYAPFGRDEFFLKMLANDLKQKVKPC
jgi:hypothetical protein